MKKILQKKILILVTIIISFNFITIACSGNKTISNAQQNEKLTKDLLITQTHDNSTITLTRYEGYKKPSILLIPGWGCNNKIFDWDENHSLARFLNNDGWDVWMLDLRTHDGDGDFWLSKDSDRERINRYWDFDRTYLKIDVVTAVEIIKEKTQCEKIIFLGHSMGGLLCYAYAELIDQDDIAGIILIGSSGMGYSYTVSLLKHFLYGIRIGKRAFVNPFGSPYSHVSLMEIKRFSPLNPYYFYENTTLTEIQNAYSYTFDDEPAGVYVDVLFGKDTRFYYGHWVDPQTLYDYTANLEKIKVNCLFIAGDEDIIDPVGDMYVTYVKIGSEEKKFLHYPYYGHMDLLLGKNASEDIFPDIICWLNTLN